MKLSLSFKLFLLFILMNVSSVSVLVITNRHFSSWGFDLYTRFLIRDKMENLAKTLSAEHEKNRGWNFLKNSPETWESLIQDTWPINDTDIMVLTKNAASPESVIPEDGASGQDKSSLSFLLQNITMYNGGGKRIAGAERELDEFEHEEIVPIGAGDDTIGWLAIDFGPRVAHPKDQEVTAKQLFVFNTIGGAMLLVSAIVIFFFSKHLLAPMQQLSAAMKALTQRHLHTRVTVRRNDELGILAEGFNTMATQLERYDRNQLQWLTDISHELRTPLSVLIGEIDAYEDGVFKLDSVSLHALGDEAKHLRKIIEDLHFISLAEADRSAWMSNGIRSASTTPKFI